MQVDWLIVGAGLTGLTVAERAARARGETVLVIDQRDHLAGNACDAPNREGIVEHRYGPHIFHTNSRNVWEYLSRFTAWRPYEHRVLASIEGRLVPLPFNLDSIDLLFPRPVAQRLTAGLLAHFGAQARVPILKLRASPERDMRFLADYVYRQVFEGYTLKQWGLLPEELLPSVTARVPVSVSRDGRYFQDTYQAMPRDGYLAMARRMVDHPNIRVLLNTPWKAIENDVRWKRLVFTGAVDEFFEFRHGPLPYRSLRFDSRTLPMERFQSAAVVNYPNAHPYTRITEAKWLTGQIHPRTALITEYPMAHAPGTTVPYYPVPTAANRRIHARYGRDTAGLPGNVTFVGRLADYTYYNMDQAVARALSLMKNAA